MSHVDSSSPITHVSLCAGYGGIDLGLKRAIPSLRTIAFSEIEAFACANLVSKMEAGLLDPAPIWTDLKTFPWSEFHGCVDILSGGYPCQPFSAAGKRLGAEDPRHLWPHISAGIAAMRPSVCFFENVEGHISLGLPDVIEDLAGLGYRTTWGIFSASEVGAPHQRKRVFILAHRTDIGLPQFANIGAAWRTICPTTNGNLEHADLAGWAESHIAGEPTTSHQLGRQRDEGLADSDSGGSRQDRESSESWTACTEQSPSDSRGSQPQQIREGQAWPSRPGEQQYEWEPPRVVGNAAHPNRWTGDSQAQAGAGPDSEWRRRLGESGAGELANGALLRVEGLQHDDREAHCARSSEVELSGSDSDSVWTRQTQSSLGGSLNGPTHRLDHAELHVSTDNRTDELRLLGNGVVPATAERAFRILLGELMEVQA